QGNDSPAGPQGISRQPAVAVIRIVLLVCGTILVLLAALYLLYELRAIIRWLLIAIFLAVALNPAVAQLQRMRLSRLASTIVVFVAMLVAVGLLAAVVVPPVSDQVRGMIEHVSEVAKQKGGINAE